MSTYTIEENLLSLNDPDRPRIVLHPIGVVIHETATPNATAENEVNYFKTHDAHASAHYFVDADKIVRDIPEDEVAYHAGPTANGHFLSIELCHFDDAEKFAAIWERGVWLAADMCHRYGWSPVNSIHSHAWVSETYHEVDHTDPVGYFAQHGKDMNHFIADVETALKAMAPAPAPVSPAAPPKYNLPTGVYQSGADAEAVEEIQTALNAINFGYHKLSVDGCYGPDTVGAVHMFQVRYGLTPDGVYGPNTRAKILEVLG